MSTKINKRKQFTLPVDSVDENQASTMKKRTPKFFKNGLQQSPGFRASAKDDSHETVFNPSTGLVFVARFNTRNKCFVPSTMNYFGPYKVSRVQYSSGYGTLLIPFAAKEDVELIIEFYAKKEYQFDVRPSTDEKAPTLVIRGGSFDIKLACDLLPDADKIEYYMLRFSLCSEDIQFLVERPKLMRLLSLDSKSLRILSEFKRSEKTHPRRTHAVLGRSPTKFIMSIGINNHLWFVKKSFSPEWFSTVQGIMNDISPDDLDPEDFQDWEDDDADCDDDNGSVNLDLD